MKKRFLSGTIALTILWMTMGCSKSDSTSTNNPTSDNLVGTWTAKSMSGGLSLSASPVGSINFTCTNVSGTMTFNSNNAYSGTSITGTCTYPLLGQNIPISLPDNMGASGTYTRSGNNLTITPASGGNAVNMTIQELTSTRLVLNLTMSVTGGTVSGVYTYEK